MKPPAVSSVQPTGCERVNVGCALNITDIDAAHACVIARPRWKAADSTFWGSILLLRHQAEQVLLFLFANSEMWQNRRWVIHVNAKTQRHKVPVSHADTQKCAVCKLWDHRGWRRLQRKAASDIKLVAACCVSWKLKVRRDDKRLILQERLHRLVLRVIMSYWTAAGKREKSHILHVVTT